jgi:hypothetical protein
MADTRSAQEHFEAQLVRTVDRLRTLGLARLEASFEPEATRVEAARALAQRFADQAAGLAGHPVRVLPPLATAATGDQLAVCGHDLVAACDRAATGPSADVDEILMTAADLLLDLRRRM